MPLKPFHFWQTECHHLLEHIRLIYEWFKWGNPQIFLEATIQRPVDVKQAKEIISRRGGFTAALQSLK